MTAFHGPGDLLDRHNLDPAAHGGAFMTVGSVQGPRFIVPPASVIAASSTSAWSAANFALFNRFHVPVAKSYRYVNLYAGTASGNIQVGVSSLALNNATTVYSTRVAHSGLIVAPTGGAPAQIDLGEFTLTPGDYGLFLFCDNVTATFPQGIATGWHATRTTFGATVTSAGVGSGILQLSASTRWLSGFTLEASS